ncbi:DUF6470 family protein [Salinibacillus xinjiangensis]|uniref:YviE n=1 Tax=Salinibacillus xinjiangensis TaxID=1229268 RepID=A0A6G1X1H4_9BACI|nr:DUF6470 family protein [Salinibacillus xinjiangensis]MRG84784.1 hypothetical protein [Salinibacillus xinjiangensis]
MQLPQIRLQSQMAKTELNIFPAKQSIQQPEAEITIEQPKADIQIDKQPSKQTIDQTQAWRDMGMVNSVEFARNFGQKGHRSADEGTSRRASEGDDLMRIENGGNPIVSHAVNNAYDPMREFNIGWIPSHNAVKIDYQPAKVNIDVQRNEPRISVQPRKPITDYQPGNVEVGKKQYANLEIDFVNVNWKETTI